MIPGSQFFSGRKNSKTGPARREFRRFARPIGLIFWVSPRPRPTFPDFLGLAGGPNFPKESPESLALAYTQRLGARVAPAPLVNQEFRRFNPGQ